MPAIGNLKASPFPEPLPTNLRERKKESINRAIKVKSSTKLLYKSYYYFNVENKRNDNRMLSGKLFDEIPQIIPNHFYTLLYSVLANFDCSADACA
jgi:hypothetical protein